MKKWKVIDEAGITVSTFNTRVEASKFILMSYELDKEHDDNPPTNDIYHSWKIKHNNEYKTRSLQVVENIKPTRMVHVDVTVDGWIQGVPVEIDVTEEEFQQQLKTGKRHLSISDCINSAADSEIVLSDFEVFSTRTQS